VVVIVEYLDFFNGLCKEYNDTDCREAEALKSLQELVNEICENPSGTAYKIQRYIEIQANELDICPHCLHKLSYKSQTDDETLEYQGKLTHQTSHTLYCPNCGRY
jgi:uncharacterized protein YbaR (Trm112 family)